MILYGCAVTDGDTFSRYAEPGVKRVTDADPESELVALPTAGTIARNYNLLCELAASRPDVEALVLLHQDVEIVDEGFSEVVRRTLADPDVAIAGAAGAIGVRSLAWWEGSVTWSSLTQRHDEPGGGGEIAGISWGEGEPPAYAATGEVDVVDGCVLVLSPWAVRSLRFDEAIGRSHGYDVDICLQARAAGRRVVTADLRVIHHHSLELLAEPEDWIRTYVAIAEKWGRELGSERDDEDWRARALRAEAEAAAYRLLMGAARLQRDDSRGKLVLTWQSASWRLGAPLRTMARRLRR